jgi:hypothetical protein
MFAVQMAPRACSFGIFSNVSAGKTLLVVYKFHAKLLFFAVFSFRVLSHCSSTPVFI